MCQLLNERYNKTRFRFTEEAVEFMKRMNLWFSLKISCKLIAKSCSNLKASSSSSA
ncbi:hypothetical protein wVul_0953 [Wolbachia endosymbiont of Armadillidium vulgare str. wVulC]|nr:hypothetical protein wVul_0953 [Wolbachia endosymbiont of Armadillidium vulgare str. wVulC]